MFWTASFGALTNAVAFDVHEDGSGGALLASVSTNVMPQLDVRRVDAAGKVAWELVGLTQFLLPAGASSWPATSWMDLAKVVPNGSGGAIVLVQPWQGSGSQPRLKFICIDSQGTAAQEELVSGRTTRQDLPLVMTGRGPLPPSAIAAWADDAGSRSRLDAWVQRFGCCPRPPQGIEREPEMPCAIIQPPGGPYGSFSVSFPCGNRDRRYGVIALSALGRTIPGLDLRACLTNRASPAPGWIRIGFAGMPPAVDVSLQNPRGKILAKGVALEEISAKFVTFKPRRAEDALLVFSRKGARDGGVQVGVTASWGEGDPPPLSRLVESPRRERGRGFGKPTGRIR